MEPFYKEAYTALVKACVNLGIPPDYATLNDEGCGIELKDVAETEHEAGRVRDELMVEWVKCLCEQNPKVKAYFK